MKVARVCGSGAVPDSFSVFSPWLLWAIQGFPWNRKGIGFEVELVWLVRDAFRRVRHGFLMECFGSSMPCIGFIFRDQATFFPYFQEDI